jgi:hypothetical protein
MLLRSTAHFLATLSFCITATCFGQEPAPPVKTAVQLGGDAELAFDSLKRILEIRSITGTFQLDETANSFRLRLDFYRKAKPIPVPVRKPGVGGQQDRRYGRFDVQIVDLDYLKLGDAPPGHCRIFVSLMTSEEPMGRGTTALAQFDVAKTTFDTRPRTGAIGRFEQFPRGDDGSIPLFYSASGQVQRANTLSELLKANPEADILVGVLEVR